jgi:hypothetical protein
VTRNSFLLLGLSFFHPSSQTGDTATQLCFVLFFHAAALSQLLLNFFYELGYPKLDWLEESPWVHTLAGPEIIIVPPRA